MKIVGFVMAGLMSWFNPVTVGMCCVSCAMKKEDEVTIETHIKLIEDINE